MLKNRIILVLISGVLIWLLFMLPKVVVNNEEGTLASDSASESASMHQEVPQTVRKQIGQLRASLSEDIEKEKDLIDLLDKQLEILGEDDSKITAFAQLLEQHHGQDGSPAARLPRVPHAQRTGLRLRV